MKHHPENTFIYNFIELTSMGNSLDVSKILMETRAEAKKLQLDISEN